MPTTRSHPAHGQVNLAAASHSQPPPSTRPPPALGKVVHLVRSVSSEVFDFLGPATSVLADAGVEQTVVLIDQQPLREALPRFHASVQLRQTPAARNPLRRWRWAMKAFLEELQRGPTQAVHLYGPIPSVVGAWPAHRIGAAITIHHFDHGSAPVPPGGGWRALLRAMMWPASPAAAAAMTPTLDPSDGPRSPLFELVERPIDAHYFVIPRNEARRPLVVTGNHGNDPRNADLYAQLAVLLGGDDSGLAFNWVGPADQAALLRLKAANVGVFMPDTVEERASRLATAWVYLAPSTAQGFPQLLVEAMAIGLSCVAVDTPSHRNVIRHGENGFLCQTTQDMVDAIAPLIDSDELRQKIGAAARQDMQLRFSQSTFRDALLAAYRLPNEHRQAR